MTIFHLVRHAAHVMQDHVMVGRTRGVALSTEGVLQAKQLGDRFRACALRLVVASPRRRARETAAAIATATGVSLDIADALDELDLGEWTGQTLEGLSSDPRWVQWNAKRARSRCPDGEAMNDVFARVQGLMASLATRHPDGDVALVSHAEPIRAVVLRTGGRSYDEWPAVDIPTASVTSLAWRRGAMHLLPAGLKAAA